MSEVEISEEELLKIEEEKKHKQEEERKKQMYEEYLKQKNEIEKYNEYCLKLKSDIKDVK